MLGSTGILWILMLSFQVSTDLSTSWYLDSHGIRITNWWRSQQIPYPDIIAVRPCNPLWELSSTRLKIEYGQLGSALNPRATTTANPGQRSAFLDHLRVSTPQAVFEL